MGKWIALVVILIFIIILYKGSSISNTTQVIAFNGLPVRVHNNSKEAANMISMVHSNLIDVLDAMKQRYPNHPYTINMLANYNPDNLFEAKPNNILNDTSFVINKGQVFALCIREKDKKWSGDPNINDLHDLNTLTFVALHELSHLAVKDIDHSPAFWSAFKFILNIAVDIGVYSPVNYFIKPQYYCGLTISHNPLFDSNIQ